MFCNKCGKELRKDENYCSNCGYKLEYSNDKKTKLSNSKITRLIIFFLIIISILFIVIVLSNTVKNSIKKTMSHNKDIVTNQTTKSETVTRLTDMKNEQKEKINEFTKQYGE